MGKLQSRYFSSSQLYGGSELENNFYYINDREHRAFF